MMTIGQLAQQFKLSRSTLLYYDRIGLLSPSGRSESGYRLYSRQDCERLKSICAYKDAGLSLDEIRTIVDNVDVSQRKVLENRLRAIGFNIQALQQQQKILAGILKIKAQNSPFEKIDNHRCAEMFRTAGMDESAMWRWHQEFERQAPQEHHAFLLALDIDEEEALKIRKKSSQPSL